MYIRDVNEYSDPDCEQEAERVLSDSSEKAVQDAVERIIEDAYDSLAIDAGDFISRTAADRCQKFLKRVLEGDDEAARELFEAGKHRYKQGGYDDGEPWASVIHNTVFETGGIRLRRQIVEAHADLIRDERIADLESIVEGLRKQIVKLKQDLDRRY